MQKAALYTSAVIFGFGAIAHAVRLADGFNISIGSFAVPVWASVPAALAAAALAIWMVAAARRQ